MIYVVKFIFKFILFFVVIDISLSAVQSLALILLPMVDRAYTWKHITARCWIETNTEPHPHPCQHTG